MTENLGDLSPSAQLTTSELSRLVTDIDAALPRVHRYAPATPILRLPILDSLIEGEALLKAECVQATGSFKVRGALNVMTQLVSDERERRVIAFSSGNHGIGVAYAARCLGMQATIVVPDDAPLAKIDRIRRLGAETVLYNRLTADREQVATALQAKYPAPLVKPYDDWHTIAGQGTCGAEVIEQIPQQIDAAIICTGGGGLAAGTGTYLKARSSDTRIMTAEPEGWHDHYLSFKGGARIKAPGNGTQWCDGLLAPIPGELTFSINQTNDTEGLCVPDVFISKAMKMAWQHLGLKLEPSGAVALAAVLSQPTKFQGQRILVTLTGGNVDDRRFLECLALAG
jgi:threonine dehydratase